MNLIRNCLIGLVSFMALASCGNREVVLPGERLDIRGGEIAAIPTMENASVPIRLSATTNHASWTHRAGSASHRIQHPAFSAAPVLHWSVDIGLGNDKRHRITADPVSANGLIFTLDSRATVVATSTAGQTVWRQDLTPDSDKSDDASGGGLAVVNGRLLVTTGFSDLTALNAADGSVEWRQRLDSPATGAPTISNGLVYIVTRDSQAWAIDASDGRVRWQLESPPSIVGIVGGAAPAVGAGFVFLPFGSAQMSAVFPKGGLQLWRSSLAGSRAGSAYAQLTDVSADPVVHGKVVYAGNPSGRTLAVNVENGDTIWSAREGATGPVWVDGGSVFLMTDQAELLRLRASNGTRIWGTQLPNLVPTKNARKRRDVFSHFGPVMAGGRLWIASGDGQLRAFNPENGSQIYAAPLPNGATTRPIVVNGVMYIVSTDGQLLAFR